MVKPKLSFVLLVLLLLAMGGGSFFIIGDPAAQIEAARERDGEVSARAIAMAIDGWFSGLAIRCEQLAAQLSGWTGSGQSLSQAPAKLDRGLGGRLDQAYVVNERSRVVAASTSVAALIDQTRGGDWVEMARTSATSISGVETDPLLKTYSIAAGVGLPISGRPSHVLICSSMLGTVDGINTSDPEPDSLLEAIGAITYPGGVRAAVIARYAAGRAEISGIRGSKTVLPADRDVVPAAQRAETEDHGSIRYRGEGDARLAASYSRIRPNWSVVLLRGEAELLGQAGRTLRFARFIVVLLLLPAIVISLVASRNLRRVEARTEDAKRAFLAIAGHELRTPLTVIRGFSQTLTSRWDRVPDDRKLDILRTISRHARSLEHLVERLLLGAQLEAGVMNAPSISDTELSPILVRVVEHHRELTHLHEIELSCPDPVTAKVDPKLFEQVMTHLVENAVKYSPSGGSVMVSAHLAGSKAVIVVEDEGVGLPADVDGIFQKFVQGEDVDTRTHDEGGVGLGLFIVKTHLDRMGGGVKAERRLPAGARFVVSVPR